MPIFFTKKSCNRGGGTPPQMPLTVKRCRSRSRIHFIQKKFKKSFTSLIQIKFDFETLLKEICIPQYCRGGG